MCSLFTKTSLDSDSFCKGGRKIRVGDCALFKPPQGSPPFIGIIRWLSPSKENNLQLGVNWIYRAAELKLGKGILLDAVPNEIFYSFHKDEIPAASLLHPCKVAFLPKGVELPPGKCSFVCRRVYDIANKCLWWLTDQDYIVERQEEINQLLYRTQVEMHLTVQPGGRSLKPVSGPTSISQLKSGSDNVQNSSTSLPSQAKRKKREHVHQGSESVKRVCSYKTDGSDYDQFKAESILKSEIAKITEKGGLVNLEGVQKLVQLMQPDSVERKLDLSSRSMLAGVIVATDKFDCLNWFVQLRGLPVLDEWLQDIRKGKIGDGCSTKDGDNSVDEFLIVLLRALDKLPVNLHALQMCNIGRSVNHLRTNKHLEIQKKARSLVDTWKKRVDAEMSIIDAKSGSNPAVSWPPKSHPPEVSHVDNRHPVGSEIAMKSSLTQLSVSKSSSLKLARGETTTKSATSSPQSMKFTLSPGSGKADQPRISSGSASDLPLTTAREEKSTSSSQSLSGKEDARSSTAGSRRVNKTSSGTSRHRKLMNSFSRPAVSSGVQRETGSSRTSSLHRTSADERLSVSRLTCKNALEVPIAEGKNHKLILKIPNRGRSPAESASGGSFEDQSIVNRRDSSPVILEKRDQYLHNLKEKGDGYVTNIPSDVNTESWQSNDFKDVLTGSDEGNGSPPAVHNEERTMTVDGVMKSGEVSKDDSLSPRKLHEVSFSPINLLIESCAKYSEISASLSAGDDVGIKLLASVAAGEISKTELVSPTDSPQGNPPIVEDTCMGIDDKPESSPVDILAQGLSQLDDGCAGDIIGPSRSKGGPDLFKQALADISVERATASFSSDKPSEERDLDSSSLDLQQSADPCVETCEKSDEMKCDASVIVDPTSMAEKVMDGEEHKHLDKEKVDYTDTSLDAKPFTKVGKSDSLLTCDNVSGVLKDEKGTVEVSASSHLLENEGENKTVADEGFDSAGHAVQKPPSTMIYPEHIERTDGKILRSYGSCREELVRGNVDELEIRKAEEMEPRSFCNQAERRRIDQKTEGLQDVENQGFVGLGSAVTNQKSECVVENVDSKEVQEHHSGGAVLHKELSAFFSQGLEPRMRLRDPKETGVEAVKTQECASTTADTSSVCVAGSPEMDAKMKFDLNEGFAVDDEKFGEPVNLTALSCSVPLMNPLPLANSLTSSSLPAFITVAAAAKGPFVPPEDLLRSKGDVGWKGSASTSAFRPAEPRKVLERPLGTADIPPANATSSSHGHPPLDFDLNAPIETVVDDMPSRDSHLETGSVVDIVNSYDFARHERMRSAPGPSSGGLYLDLNQVDEANDMGKYSTSSSRKLESLILPVKSTSSGRFVSYEVQRDFDLNNGPVLDDGNMELLFNQHGRGSMQSQPPIGGIRMRSAEMGTFSSWFPPGISCSPATIPSILSDRGDSQVVRTGAPQRIFCPTSGTPSTPDVYWGSVLSTSPTVPFPSSPYQYPIFPFEAKFPLSSASYSGASTTHLDSSSGGRLCFPAINSQLLGPAGAVSSHFPQPYMVSLPAGNNNGGADINRYWGRQVLDLNAGPGGGRDGSQASRQLPFFSSQPLVEEAGGFFKRKEPKGGLDTDGFKYK